MEGTKLSEDVTVAGQVTPEQLRQAAKEGFHSVLNLRAPEEAGVLADEKAVAENAGLSYSNIPVRKMEISDALATQVLAEIDNLPKPILIHCASGLRAGAMAFMHMATRHGMSAEDALAKAEALGFDCNSEPQLKEFLTHYIGAHSRGTRQTETYDNNRP